MTLFSAKQVKYLANLARIDLQDEELELLANELNVIENSINQLSEVAASDILPTSHPVKLWNVTREDIPSPPLSVSEALSGAPEAKNNMFLAPQILDEE